MQKINLLDCTLRDGGYVNNWIFGNSVIDKVVQNVITSGIEIMELGYLSIKDAGNPDSARFASLEDAKRVQKTTIGVSQSYAIMINFGEYPVDLLPTNAPEKAPILRVAFHKKNIQEAFEYFNELQKRGYRYYIQPMGALNYTDEEYVQLIRRANELNPEAFYIVDSFGVMEIKDFRRLLFLADNNLKKGVVLGYHAHNNLQQAYSNAKYMVEQDLDHDLVIDASVFGMGRGAGNLNIELFAEHLNEHYGKSYNIEPLLEVYDECLKPIYTQTPWGYSLPYYLSAIHNCHPNYASFFAEKNTLTVKSIHELLGMIVEEDKSSYTKDKASLYYAKYQENFIDDRIVIDELQNSFQGRDILILAPGKSISDHKEKINEYIQNNTPIVVGINYGSCDYHYDYLFIANEKRLKEKTSNVDNLIVTSNLHKIIYDSLCVNYSTYVSKNDMILDDPTIMFLNLLISLGISKVYIAGFDGFSGKQEDNYFTTGLSLGTNLIAKENKNTAITKEIKELREKIDIIFLTPSIYI